MGVRANRAQGPDQNAAVALRALFLRTTPNATRSHNANDTRPG